MGSVIAFSGICIEFSQSIHRSWKRSYRTSPSPITGPQLDNRVQSLEWARLKIGSCSHAATLTPDHSDLKERSMNAFASQDNLANKLIPCGMLKQRTRHSNHQFVNGLGQSLSPHIEDRYMVNSAARPVPSTVVGTGIRCPTGELTDAWDCSDSSAGLAQDFMNARQVTDHF